MDEKQTSKTPYPKQTTITTVVMYGFFMWTLLHPDQWQAVKDAVKKVVRDNVNRTRFIYKVVQTLYDIHRLPES